MRSASQAYSNSITGRPAQSVIKHCFLLVFLLIAFFAAPECAGSDVLLSKNLTTGEGSLATTSISKAPRQLSQLLSELGNENLTTTRAHSKHQGDGNAGAAAGKKQDDTVAVTAPMDSAKTEAHHNVYTDIVVPHPHLRGRSVRIHLNLKFLMPTQICGDVCTSVLNKLKAVLRLKLKISCTGDCDEDSDTTTAVGTTSYGSSVGSDASTGGTTPKTATPPRVGDDEGSGNETDNTESTSSGDKGGWIGAGVVLGAAGGVGAIAAVAGFSGITFGAPAAGGTGAGASAPEVEAQGLGEYPSRDIFQDIDADMFS